MMRTYGDTVIKVKVPGTYQAWETSNNIAFMVPPEEAGNIQIVGYSGPRDFKRVFRSV